MVGIDGDGVVGVDCRTVEVVGHIVAQQFGIVDG